MYMTYKIQTFMTVLGIVQSTAGWVVEQINNAIRRCQNCGTPLPNNKTWCERCEFENNDLLK